MADLYVDTLYNTDTNDFGTPSTLTATITGATAANPVVITANAHGFSNGNTVLIRSVAGMVEINNRSFSVANRTANTFELSGEDGSLHTAYTSGGTATKQMSTNNAIRFIFDDTVPKQYLLLTAKRFAEWVASKL